MSARRKAATAAAAGIAPLALSTLAAAPASAHGTMGDPVSRVAQCYAEGPERPTSAACRAAVAAGGTQALYDWNGIRIGDADGRHRELIAGRPAVQRRERGVQGAGPGPRRLAGDARRQRVVQLRLPGDGPAQGHVHGLHHPARLRPVEASGVGRPRSRAPRGDGHRPGRRRRLLPVLRHAPGAFRKAAPVRGLAAFGQSGSLLLVLRRGVRRRWGRGWWCSRAEPPRRPPTRRSTAGGAKSTVAHHGHGDDAGASAGPADGAEAAPAGSPTGSGGPEPEAEAADASVNRPEAAGSSTNLAETGGDSTTTAYLAVGGAAVLALGAATLFASVRRRAVTGGRRDR